MKMILDSIYNGDCLTVLRGMPDKSIDLCITDPPYGKKADKGTNGFGSSKNRRYQGGGMIKYHQRKSLMKYSGCRRM